MRALRLILVAGIPELDRPRSDAFLKTAIIDGRRITLARNGQ